MATFDLHLQGVPEEQLDGFKFFTKGFDRSQGVRGINKLLVQWTLLFLTPKGSDPVRPQRGTVFANLIGSNIAAAQDVQDVVLLAIEDCNEQFIAAQRLTQRDEDELLRIASLADFAVTSADGIYVQIEIFNQTGEGATVLLPLLNEV